jgi:hypothetical protein
VLTTANPPMTVNAPFAQLYDLLSFLSTLLTMGHN